MRFVIGIDLGTSNSALAYAELAAVDRLGRPEIHELAVPQLIGPGDRQSRPLLPSALYQLAKFEWPDGQDGLPWSAGPVSPERRQVIGEGAKKLGAKTPVRFVDSAKSWLCHGGVNRSAAILPWHGPDEIPKLSPVDASAAYLQHLRLAWNHEKAADDDTARFEAQRVIITVPASFDEVARQLTLEAAKRAGYPAVTLIEEPLAAFYAFIAKTGGTPAATGLQGGERVLIADVGGGTTDFTIVEVLAPETPGAALGFSRSAVGDHLLLGGDNMDLALAHALEPELTQGKKRLDAEGWAELRLECRLAKEALFSDPARERMPVVIAGRGSKLIGGQLKTELTRERLEQVIVEGYFPALPPGEAALPRVETRGGFAEYGLPYASEPAITRHLAAFLLRHRGEGEPVARVDRVLYNGGALKPARLRDHLSGTLGAWLRASGRPEHPDPPALIYDEGDRSLELAVARGAAYFGLVREGRGLRVGGGSPRAFYLALEGEAASASGAEELTLLCVAPKGMQDGQELEVSSREFELVTNRPVSFPIYTSTGPETHAVGSLHRLHPSEVVALPPLETVVRFGKQKAGTTLPVRLQARRSEVGTLELSCFSKMSGARFKLEFDLRAEGRDGPRSGRASAPPPSGAGPGAKDPVPAGELEEAKLSAGREVLLATFALEPPRPDPEPVMKRLEAALGVARGEIPLGTLRALAEQLIELQDRRGLSPELEVRWLNLVGFFLRPGRGFALDDWRVKQLWRIHAGGLVFPGRDQGELNWWILWRRVASGLGRGHQEELASVLFPLLIPSLEKRAKRRPPRAKSQEAAEMWRCAASLENLAAKSRAQLGQALVELIAAGQAPKGALWALGRIGARQLLYGPKEATVRAAAATEWTERLLTVPDLGRDEDPVPALVSLARRAGDRQLDVDDAVRARVRAYLEARGAHAELLRPLDEVVVYDAETERQAFGEGLPVGLRLGG